MTVSLHGENLVVSQHQRVVLGPLSLSVNAGEKIALVGGNGSGKTTLLRTLAGLQRPLRGQLQCHAKRLSFMPDHPPTESALTVRELLQEWALLRDVEPSAVETFLHQLDLREVAERACSRLSLGFRQRVALAMCLLPKPDLLLLDEPSNGLDPQHQLLLQQLLQQHTDSLIVVTHHIEAWQHHCTRVWALHQGELIFDGAMTDYLASKNRSAT